MAKFRKYPIDNTFTTSSEPVGEYERLEMVKHIAHSIKYQGLRPNGQALLFAEAHKYLSMVDTIHTELPAPDNPVWQEYGKTFGKWKIIVYSWEGTQRIHMLRTQGASTVHYKRYRNKGQWYYVELAPDLSAVKGTKLSESEFMAKIVAMTRSPFPKQVEHTASAVVEYINNSFRALNNLE